MIRGTTPVDTITIRNPGDLDLTEMLEVYVTIRQDGVPLTKTGADITVEKAAVSYCLTQQESLQFREGEAEAQINWTYMAGQEKRRGATKWLKVRIDRQLLDRVL